MSEAQLGAVRVRPWIRRTARVLLPILLLIAAWQVWDNVEARRLDPLLRRLQEAQRKTVDPLERNLQLQPWSQANDAARYYTAAAAIAHHDYLRPGARDHLTARRAAVTNQAAPSAEVAAAAAEVVAANEWPLRLLDHAAGLPMRFAARTGDTNRVSGLLAVGRAASHRTLDRALKGDSAGAIDSLIAKARLQRAFAPDQWGFGLTAGGQEIVRGLAADTGLVLSLTTPTPAEFARLDAAISELSDPDAVTHTVAEMGLFRYDLVRSLHRGALPIARPAANYALRMSMNTMVRALDAARLPWPDRITAIHGLTDEEPFLRLGPSGLWLVSGIVKNAAMAASEAEAVVRTIRAVLVLEQQGGARGLPSTDELQFPATLADPFTGQRLKVAAAESGYVVYSVGRDRRDDGGSLDPAPQRGVSTANAPPKDVGVRVRYLRAASTSPSNSGLNSPVR